MFLTEEPAIPVACCHVGGEGCVRYTITSIVYLLKLPNIDMFPNVTWSQISSCLSTVQLRLSMLGASPCLPSLSHTSFPPSLSPSHTYTHAVDNRLDCPKCRKVTYLGNGGIDALPSNYALNDLLEILPPDDTSSFPSTPIDPCRPFPGKDVDILTFISLGVLSPLHEVRTTL
jgi:hypothetical protein